MSHNSKIKGLSCGEDYTSDDFLQKLLSNSSIRTESKQALSSKDFDEKSAFPSRHYPPMSIGNKDDELYRAATSKEIIKRKIEYETLFNFLQSRDAKYENDTEISQMWAKLQHTLSNPGSFSSLIEELKRRSSDKNQDINTESSPVESLSSSKIRIATSKLNRANSISAFGPKKHFAKRQERLSGNLSLNSKPKILTPQEVRNEYISSILSVTTHLAKGQQLLRDIRNRKI